MSKQHTPGPWTVIPPGHGSETEYLCVQIGGDDSYTTLEMLPADAHLIAAAPDLEGALDALISWEQLPPLSAPAMLTQLAPVLDRAKVALAKARGEGQR